MPLETTFRCEPKSITVARQVVLKAMCYTPVLVATKVTGIAEVSPHANEARNYACKIVKGIIDVLPGRDFKITIGNFGMADFHLPKH